MGDVVFGYFEMSSTFPLLSLSDSDSLLGLNGSGYGYGIIPGGRWAIDTEYGHVVDSVSLKYKMAMNTEGGHVVDTVSRPR